MENNQKIGFLEEEVGSKSITRAIVLGVTVIATIFASIILISGLKYIKEVGDLLTLGTAVLSVFGGMFTLAVSLKVIQKGQENSATNDQINS